MGCCIEHWRPVVGFEGLYEVSDEGRIASLGRTLLRVSRNGTEHTVSIQPRIMKQSVACLSASPRGYPGVTLTGRDIPGRQHLVHHLVLTAFRGTRPGGYEGAHLNGDQFDNRLENLAWKTPKENSADAYLHGARQHDSTGRFSRTCA